MQMNLNECLTVNPKNNVCPICHDSGWEECEKDGHKIYRECRCGIRQKQIMKNRLSFADIPESFKNTRLDSFDIAVYEDAKNRIKAETVVKAVNYWLNDFENMNERGMGLYLYSDIKGSGKTKMAVSIANELMYEKHIQVKFATSLQILNEIKASWGKSESQHSESRLLDFLSTTKVLIIDDFGVEKCDKNWINERFYHIINSRYIDRKITIFTSNSRLDLLQYDNRITNRVKERTFQIPFPEESVRDIIAKKNMEELIDGIKKHKG